MVQFACPEYPPSTPFYYGNDRAPLSRTPSDHSCVLIINCINSIQHQRKGICHINWLVIISPIVVVTSKAVFYYLCESSNSFNAVLCFAKSVTLLLASAFMASGLTSRMTDDRPQLNWNASLNKKNIYISTTGVFSSWFTSSQPTQCNKASQCRQTCLVFDYCLR